MVRQFRRVHLVAAGVSVALGLLVTIALVLWSDHWGPSLILGGVVAMTLAMTWFYLLRLGQRLGRVGTIEPRSRSKNSRRASTSDGSTETDSSQNGVASTVSLVPVPQKFVKSWAAVRQGATDGISPQWEQGESFHGSGAPFSHDIPVVMIADDFTYESFEPEFDLHRLFPDNWREVMDSVQPKLFICESAWRGGPGNPWQGRIYASTTFRGENRKVLKEILAYCKQAGIPTVFWCKEDPVYFTHRVSDFVRTAILFDYIFTTAEECVELYYKHARATYADVLPFAVQPKLFNPLGSEKATDSVSFAGTWYSQYPQRKALARELMNLALRSGRELIIYDRMSESPDERYRYPAEFNRNIRPAISYAETADAYRASRFGITLNTITDSRTMFARRAFELAASGAVVLSNTARGVKEFFGDAVIYADAEPERFLELDEAGFQDLRGRGASVAMRHTYRQRAETILSTVGIRFSPWLSPPDLVMKVRDHGQFGHGLRLFSANRHQVGRLAVVVSDDAPGSLVMDLMQEPHDGVVVGNLDEYRSGRSRIRGLLSSRQAFLVDSSTSAVPDLGLLAAHSIYQPLPVAEASADTQFTTGQAARSGLLVPAEEVLPLLDDDEPVEVYQV